MKPWAIFFALLTAGAVASAAAAAEPTDWFHDARWGVMTHYLGAPPSSPGGAELTAEAWNRQVDGFDVNRFADQIASTGAQYLLFTIGQNSGHYCSPNATYDRIVGIRPSKCAHRDLIADLAKALSARKIRLMVYLPSGAPGADWVARKKLGWHSGKRDRWQLPGEPVGGRLAAFQRNWEAVIREWSVRWGRGVAGWWVDGCYFADQMYRFDDEPNFASFARAMKAGNPQAIVAFNPGVKIPVIAHTKYDDYSAGEVNRPQLSTAIDAAQGRWLACEGCKVQFHILSFLGTSWCKGERPQLPDEQIVACTRKMAAKGGVITYDVPIDRSGLIPPPFVEQLRALGRAMTEPTPKAAAAAPATPRPVFPLATGAGLPVFHHQGVVLDYRNLKYNPCNDVIIPSVVRVDGYFQRPLGRYYMYYAPHNPPGGICLAHADRLEGPWKEYQANPLIHRDWPPHYKVSHVSGPHAIWIEEERKLFVYYHGENDVTRFASTTDGIHFQYEGVAFTTKMFPDVSEASYARMFRYTIPGKDNRFIALLMGNNRGTRRIYLAWSKDGRRWEPRPTPLVDPPPGTAQVAQAWFLPWQGKHYLVYHAHWTVKPLVADLHVSQVDAALASSNYLGLFYDHASAGPDNVAQMSPCIVDEQGKLYLFTNIGPRLNQKIALATADAEEAPRP
jgi:hypothetical protein